MWKSKYAPSHTPKVNRPRPFPVRRRCTARRGRSTRGLIGNSLGLSLGVRRYVVCEPAANLFASLGLERHLKHGGEVGHTGKYLNRAAFPLGRA